MPTTVNGIGTHYYGKKNREVRKDYCRSCNHLADLKSYDTRLWFVIVFIPIVPLGRKRIIDECPFCSRHYASDLKQYEMHRQLGVSGALEEFRNDPSVDRGLAAHAVMLGFHQRAEAKTLRDELLTQLGEREDLLEGIASQLESVNSFDEATPYFERLLKVNPKSPTGRIGISWRKMNSKDLDQASELLNFLMEPGAGKVYSLGVIEVLAGNYQKVGKHQEALRIYEHLLKELPQVGQVLNFRKTVQKSEKAAGRLDSMLPESDARWWHLLNGRHQGVSGGARFAAYALLAIAVAAIGMLGRNEYLRRNRSLYIVNALPVEAHVKINQQPVQILRSRSLIHLPEGNHQVEVKIGSDTSTSTLTMGTGYFERWWNQPIWVFNVGRAAGLAETNLVYSANPKPSITYVRAGELTSYFPHVDYPFVKPPDQLTTKGNGTLQKVHVELDDSTPAELVAIMVGAEKTDAIDVAESWMKYGKPTDDLTTNYEALVHHAKAQERGIEFLKQGLNRRPVEISWHRVYQNLREREKEKTILLNEYRQLHESSPEDGRLTYLYARLISNPAENESLLEASARQAPDSYWPHIALAYQKISRGEWENSEHHLREAERLQAPPRLLKQWRHFILMGCGKFDELIQGYRQELAAQPMSSGIQYLTDALAAQGKSQEALETFNLWKSRIPAEIMLKWSENIEELRRQVLYQTGDLEKLGEALKGPAEQSSHKISYLLANLKPEEIQDPQTDPSDPSQSAWTKLMVATAYDQLGKHEEAANWRSRAIAEMKLLGEVEQFCGEILEKEMPSALTELDYTGLSFVQKAQLLASLAARFPEKRQEYVPLLEKLNVSRSHPYLFLRRIAQDVPAN